MKKLFVSLIALFGLFIISSCYEPSPLYGKWQDTTGNSISFIQDGTYNATIYNAQTQGSATYEGTYQVLDNVLILSRDSGNLTTEWDIQGNKLILNWDNQRLVLYHVSK